VVKVEQSSEPREDEILWTSPPLAPRRFDGLALTIRELLDALDTVTADRDTYRALGLEALAALHLAVSERNELRSRVHDLERQLGRLTEAGA